MAGETGEEEILDPDLPIIDPHHHLWDRGRLFATLPPPSHAFEHMLRLSPRYLLDQLLADLNSGHKVLGTVFLQCTAMHKADGPEHLKPIGETEFVNGVAAMAASGLYGEVRVCDGIVGFCDLRIGADLVDETLSAHLGAGGGRFRGIRHSASFDEDVGVLGPLRRTVAGLYADPQFREGFARLAAFDLSFDAWLLEPQLPELIDLARAFPEQPIVLDHVGTPLGIAGYEGRRDERFGVWRESIRELAKSPKVMVKLGGLAMPFCGFPSFMSEPRASSEQLAAEWRPYVETCIEAFGVERCMFESNFPVDYGTSSYAVLWNAFKRLAAGASTDEKHALFSDTARRFYRLSI